MKTRKKLNVWLALSMFLLMMACTAAGQTIYVDADGPADFNTIQAAIDDSNDGDTIIVGPGIYTGDGNRDIDFLGKAITVRSIDPCNSDVVAATIIDCQGSKSEPHRGFKFVSSEETDSVLAGLTITNGYAPRDMSWASTMVWVGGAILCDGSSPTISYCTIANNWSNWSGGGIYNRGSSPTLTNCIITGNKADTGGGMANWENSSPTLTNCIFSGNRSDWGGGMHNRWSSSPSITNCTFSRNSAESGGGMNNYYSSPSITNCTFSGNSAELGGGVFNWGSSPTLTNCLFSNNSSREWGGGMFNYYSSPTVPNCIVWANTAPSGPQIHNDGTSSATVSYSDVQGGWPGEGNIDADPCFVRPEYLSPISYWKFDGSTDDSAGDNDGTVYGNPVWTIGQLGGALNFDGAGDYVDCGNDSSLNPTNNFSVSAWFKIDSACVIGTIVCKGDARAWETDGAYTIFCNLINGVVGFYVRKNNNNGFNGLTIAVSLNEWIHVVGTFSDGNISIYKNGVFVQSTGLGTPTIYSNNGPLGIGAEGDGGMAFNGTIDEVAIHNRALSGEEIEQLYQIGVAGLGDYHLLPDSPCINAGDPDYAAEPNETDLDGKPRVIGGRIDMGAYEFNHIPVADAGPNQTVEAEGAFGARVTLDGSGSSDADSAPGTNDDIVCFDWYKVDACDPNFEDFLASGEIIDCNLPLGEHIIILEVIDKAGAFDTNEVTIIVQDTTPPDFTLSVTPTTLWPANHKMVLITPSWTASDICDTSPEVSLVSITMDEDDEAKGDGHTTLNIQIGDDGAIYLRAERSGTGSGRIYTITYQAVDDSGNAAVARATVTVPHNQR